MPTTDSRNSQPTTPDVDDKKPPRGNWTDERITLLKKLFADGYSASQIATQLGGGLSRNAVIGKLTRSKTNLGPRKRRSTKGQSREERSAKSLRSKGAIKLTPKSAPLPLPTAPVIDGAVAYLDRKDDQCAWPCWPHDLRLRHADVTTLRCCGADVPETPPGERRGAPYCAYHYQVSIGGVVAA